jgi:hypothetical protein
MPAVAVSVRTVRQGRKSVAMPLPTERGQLSAVDGGSVVTAVSAEMVV